LLWSDSAGTPGAPDWRQVLISGYTHLREEVRAIKQKQKEEQEPELTRVNINIPTSLHRQFKSITAAEGTDMTRVLMVYIEEYIREHSASSKQPKGKRG
jgi:hypothetical protein